MVIDPNKRHEFQLKQIEIFKGLIKDDKKTRSGLKKRLQEINKKLPKLERSIEELEAKLKPMIAEKDALIEELADLPAKKVRLTNRIKANLSNIDKIKQEMEA